MTDSTPSLTLRPVAPIENAAVLWDILRAMIAKSWRFVLGALIGARLGYALALLVQPAPRRQAERWRTLYQAAPEEREEQPAA